jgi:hypothetical protein
MLHVAKKLTNKLTPNRAADSGAVPSILHSANLYSACFERYKGQVLRRE